MSVHILQLFRQQLFRTELFKRKQTRMYICIGKSTCVLKSEQDLVHITSGKNWEKAVFQTVFVHRSCLCSSIFDTAVDRRWRFRVHVLPGRSSIAKNVRLYIYITYPLYQVVHEACR